MPTTFLAGAAGRLAPRLLRELGSEEEVVPVPIDESGTDAVGGGLKPVADIVDLGGSVNSVQRLTADNL